jgi:hypothetical protein
MAFNIDRFKENLNSFGYIKNNSFEVFVHIPKFLQNKSMRINGRETNVNNIGSALKYRVNRVTTPGVSLNTTDIFRYGIGTTQKMPYGSQFSDVSLSMMLDRNTDFWDFWYNWTNGIYNFNGQEPNGNNIFAGGRIPNLTVEYKDEYSSTMTIIIYDAIGRAVKKIHLYEAYPSSLREMDMAWSQSNLMALSLTITYTSYSMEGSNVIDNAAMSGVQSGSEVSRLTTLI